MSVPAHPIRPHQRARVPMWFAAILGAIAALAAVEFYAIQKYGRLRAPEAVPAAVAPAAPA